MEKLDEGPAVAMTPVSVISDFWHILPLFFSFIHVFSFSPRAATFLSLDVVGKIPSGLQNIYHEKPNMVGYCMFSSTLIRAFGRTPL
jgi:hypothetical protein